MRKIADMNTRGDSNDNLAIEFKEGSTEALNRIYLLYFRSLCFFANRIIDDQLEAEDIVAESFIKLWHKHNDFETLTNIKAFLFITTKNSCLNYVKKMERQTSIHEQLQREHVLFDDDIYFAELESEMLQLLYNEIERLPRKCRNIFKLIYLEGLKTNEIALQLDISNKTVLNQKLRAIQLLKSALFKKELLFLLLLLRIDF
ncbi:MAG: RNA polymerase sigma-70 factor [Bacteroidetes bacterium]|nr:RNA polymerase sigma-70 factor [Bacteroidota bacterium]